MSPSGIEFRMLDRDYISNLQVCVCVLYSHVKGLRAHGGFRRQSRLESQRSTREKESCKEKRKDVR